MITVDNEQLKDDLDAAMQRIAEHFRLRRKMLEFMLAEESALSHNAIAQATAYYQSSRHEDHIMLKGMYIPKSEG